jgi:hypothetical protein
MKLNKDPVDYFIGFSFGAIFSLPFGYFLVKHGKKRDGLKILQQQLNLPTTKIWKGQLKNKKERFIIQKVVKSKDVEESSYIGGAFGSGSSIYHPVYMIEDKNIINKEIRSVLTFKRFR